MFEGGRRFLKPFEVSCRRLAVRPFIVVVLAALCCLPMPVGAFTPFMAHGVRVEGAERLAAHRAPPSR